MVPTSRQYCDAFLFSSQNRYAYTRSPAATSLGMMSLPKSWLLGSSASRMSAPTSASKSKTYTPIEPRQKAGFQGAGRPTAGFSWNPVTRLSSSTSRMPKRRDSGSGHLDGRRP